MKGFAAMRENMSSVFTKNTFIKNIFAKNIWEWGLPVMGILCIAYCCCIYFFMGFGTKFFLIWGLFGTSLILTSLVLTYMEKKGGARGKLLKKWVQISFLVGLIFFALVEGRIMMEFNDHAAAGADYVVVLGAQMKKNGPSDVLRRRLDKAAEYLQENPNTKVIVSGGQGANEHVSEAQGMRDYLVNNAGIDISRIILEDQSENTMENFAFSKQHIVPAESRVVIVTNNFHMYRAKGIAMKAGYGKVECLSSSAYIGMIPNNMLREFFGVLKDFLIGNMQLW